MPVRTVKPATMSGFSRPGRGTAMEARSSANDFQGCGGCVRGGGVELERSEGEVSGESREQDTK